MRKHSYIPAATCPALAGTLCQADTPYFSLPQQTCKAQVWSFPNGQSLLCCLYNIVIRKAVGSIISETAQYNAQECVF